MSSDHKTRDAVAAEPRVEETSLDQSDTPKKVDQSHAFDEPRTAEEVKLDRRILLKTDACVLSLLVIVATFEFLDKNALAYAAILGLKDDAKLVNQQYSWLGSIFYFGYLSMLPPTLWILTKVPAGKVIGISTTGWGISLICMAACQNFAGLAAVRFLLGMFEATILPCFMIMSATWWKRSEQALRTALWYNTFAGIFGGILAWAMANIPGPLSKWRYLFIIYGSITTTLGIFTTLMLPTTPGKAWFLTASEKLRAVERVASNQQGKMVAGFKRSQCVEALKSPSYWILITFTIAQSVTNAGITNFNPLIINGFGYSPQRTTLLATPQAAVAFVAQFSLGLLAQFVPNIRCIIWCLSTLPALAGAMIVRLADHEAQRNLALGGVYLMGFYNVSWVMALSLSTSNNSGMTKKSFASTSIAIAYAVGNIIGPQFFRTKEAPTYQTGIFAMFVCFAIMFATGAAYAAVQIITNKKRSREMTEELDQDTSEEEDLTDGQNSKFRYSY
ncbi:putative allantoate permease [Dactylonectria macrodidyma]|uniref:Allantoate permease n=1 Tax=Dactylonectria macrodidyma TaxID=307937 RepID=A0A9P9E1W0_9HYPO|nr:putative allantoate permease [Dactylonectria macrodidyma]